MAVNKPDNAMSQALQNAGVANTAAETQAATQPQATPVAQQPEVGQAQAYGQTQNGFAASSYQQQQAAGGRGRFSWLGVGSLSGRPVSVSPMGEALRNLQNEMSSFWDKNLEENLNLSMIPVDQNNIPNLAVSLLIVTMKADNKPNSPVAYHTLLVGGSVEDFPSTRETIQGFPVDVMTLTSDAYDSVMKGIVFKVVKQANPQTPDDKLIDADAEVVSRGFDYTSEELLHGLTLNCVLACRTALDTRNDDFVDLSLANVIDDATLNLYVKYHQGHEKDYAGEPVRSDITVDLRAAPRQQQNQRFGGGQQTVSRATGYIDLLWAQNQNLSNPYLAAQTAMAGYNPQLQQTYQANFVLTSVTPVNLQTVPAVLTSLLTASYVCDNNNWIGALRPVYDGTGRAPLHDIGAIGYEVKPTGEPAAIKTTPDVFQIGNLASLVAAYFHPGILMSLDVPEVGSQSWMLGIFAQAATGNAQAMDYIRWAANHLTNGAFDKHYRGTGRLVSTNYNIILNGYYSDEKGNRRDIRDIDYLVVAAELGGKDPALLVDYTDSFASVTRDPTLRSCMRQQIIQNLRPSVVWTGKSLRVDFEAAFVEALAMAAQENNFILNAQFPDNNAVVTERAAAGYVNGAVLSNFNSGIFRTGYAGFNPNGTSTVGGYMGRWGNR